MEIEYDVIDCLKRRIEWALNEADALCHFLSSRIEDSLLLREVSIAHKKGEMSEIQTSIPMLAAFTGS